jgi:hypothetical protein
VLPAANGPDVRLRRLQLVAATCAGLLASLIPVGTAIWSASEERQKIYSIMATNNHEIQVNEEQIKELEARVRRLVEVTLKIREDVSELKGGEKGDR